MNHFLLGMLVMYLISGIFILAANTLHIDDEDKDIVFGWWLIPVIVLYRKIKNKKKMKMLENKINEQKTNNPTVN